MSFEDRLDEAMRATAESVQPRVASLVDGGIARGRRKRRLRRAATMAGGSLTAVAIGTAVVLIAPHAATVQNFIASGGDTTPDTLITEEAVFETLEAVLPPGDLSIEWSVLNPTGGVVNWSGVYDDGDGASYMSGIAGVTASVAPRECPADNPGRNCTVEVLSDGSELKLETGSYGRGESADRQAWSVTLHRPDGFIFALTEINAPTEIDSEISRPEPPLSVDELRAIATDGRWTALVNDEDRAIVVERERELDQQMAEEYGKGDVAEAPPRLVIEDPNPGVSGDQLEALLEDVAALFGGTFEHLPSLQSPMSLIRLDFGDLGVGQVRANSIDNTMASGDPCGPGLTECEVLLDTDAAVVLRANTPSGSRLAYLAKTGGSANLSVWAETVGVRAGTTAGDLGFDDANELRDAILAAVPDAETPGRGEFTAAELDDVAREVAGLSMTTRGEFVRMDGPSRSGRVSFGEGTGFEIRASHDLVGNDLDVWTESCERGASDGKPCTELLNTGEIGVFASTYPNQGNRESLRYVADLADGTLIIVFDNYMETAAGKVVGSSISDAGIDPDELAAVVENSGVLDN